MKMKNIVLFSFLIAMSLLIQSCTTSQKYLDEQARIDELRLETEAQADKTWGGLLLQNDLEHMIEAFTKLKQEDVYVPSVIRGLTLSKLAWENGFDIYPLVEDLLKNDPADPYSLILLQLVHQFSPYQHEQYSSLMGQLSRNLRLKTLPDWLKREYRTILFDYYYNNTGDMDSCDHIKEDLGILESWTFLGPFPNISGSGYKRDFAVIPEDPSEFISEYSLGQNNWELDPFLPQLANPGLYTYSSQHVSSRGYSSVYAQKIVKIEDSGLYEFVISRKGSFELWIDGIKIMEEGTYRQGDNAYYYQQELQKGRHSVIMKMNNREEESYFSISCLPVNQSYSYESALYDSLFPEKTQYYDPLLVSLCQKIDQGNNGSEAWFWLSLSLLTKGWDNQAFQTISHLQSEDSPLYKWLMARYYNLIKEPGLYDREMIALGEEGDFSLGIEYMLDFYISAHRIGHCEDFLDDFEGDRLYYQRTLARMKLSLYYDRDDVFEYFYKLNRRYPNTGLAYKELLDWDYRLSYDERKNFIDFFEANGYYRLSKYFSFHFYYYYKEIAMNRLSAYLKEYPDSEDLWIIYLELMIDFSNYSTVSENFQKIIKSFPYSYDLNSMEYHRAKNLYNSMKNFYNENKGYVNSAGSNGTAFVKEMNEEEVNYQLILEKMVRLFPYSLKIRDELHALNDEELVLDNIFFWDSFAKIEKFNEKEWVTEPSDAIIVFDDRQEIYFGDGASKFVQHLIMKVNTLKGAEDNRYQYLEFNTNNVNGKVLEAFVLKADGTRIFADIGARKVAFSGLAPGDFLILRYNADFYDSGELNNQIWSSIHLADEYPIYRKEFKLVYPEDMEMNIQENHVAEGYLEMEQSDFIKGLKQIDIVVDQKEAMDFSAFGPSWKDFVPWVDFSTFQNWAPVIEWYSHLTEGQFDASYSLIQKASELCEGAKSEEEKIRNIFDFVSGTIEYEDLTFLYSAYVPQTADSVLEDLYGDCKDQSALLVSLLKLAGIESELVLSLPGYSGNAPYLPSPRFSHVFVMVNGEKGPLYLDPTTSYYTYGEVPASLVGTYILPIREGEELRALDGDRESQKSFVLMEMDHLTGQTSVRGDFSYQGYMAGLFRYDHKEGTPEYQKEIFQLNTNSWMPGFVLEDLEIQNVEHLFYDPMVHFQGTIPSPLFPGADKNSKQLVVPWMDLFNNVTRSWIAAPKQDQGIQIAARQLSTPVTQTVIFHLGSGRVQNVPVDVEYRFGNSYVRYKYEVSGDTLICTRDVWIENQIIPEEKLDEFKQFMGNAIRKEQENCFIRY